MEGMNISIITEIPDLEKFQIRNSKILVRPSEEDAPKTAGGVLLPGTSKIQQEMLAEGKAVCVSQNIQDIKSGDTVYFYRHHSEGCVRQGEDICFIFSDYNILAYTAQ